MSQQDQDRESKDVIEIVHGDKRGVFRRTAAGWAPDWFYEGGRPMLRFKDHEWLSLGHVHPTHADSAERLAGGGAIFRGTTLYGRTAVAWSVTVRPDPLGAGFDIECSFTPAETIELLEAYSSFETPYEYSGAETATTVIGMNPVSKWRGNERLSPPIWENPAWVYSRPQSVRITARCGTPYLFQAITDAGPGGPQAGGGVGDRFVTVIGDWNVCKVQDVYVNPTRDAAAAMPSVFGNAEAKRGYKYLVGALNWSSAYAKDPNVLFAAGVAHRQRVLVDFAGRLPGVTLDEALLAAWQRTAELDLPRDGRVAAYERATARGATWQAAAKWLRDVLAGDRYVEGLYKPGVGIRTYAPGARPKAGPDYSWGWWTQWAGPLHYRAAITGDAELEAACGRNDELFAAHSAGIDYFHGGDIATKVTSIPSVWWVRGGGRGGALYEAMRPMLQAARQQSAAEKGGARAFDSGAQASLAEALLLGADAYDAPAMEDQALVLLAEMNAKLDGSFWEFNVGRTGSLMHGGQIRSLGHGHAVHANILAARRTGDAKYLAAARRFARYLLAISYTTHNGSSDPDFDWRGWCNGSNAGRDQIAEYPPWETQNGLLCLTTLLGETDVEAGPYDALWYIARTGLAQFPAARSLKRVLDESMQVHYVPRAEIASERDFYDPLPYLAYENPHDQTLTASYQGSDCILGEMVYGGGLATASDARLGVLVPRAATMDLGELTERIVHVWNPTRDAIDATITATWPAAGGQAAQKQVKVPPRQAVRVVFNL
jgi:hypothetical protein